MSGKIKKQLEKLAGHQAVIAAGPAGHVKFYRSSNVSGHIKQMRHMQHMRVEIYGVWWCQNELAATHLKECLESYCKAVFQPAEGSGFYCMACPPAMADAAVKLAAAQTGVVIFSTEDRDTWLDDQVRARQAQIMSRGMAG